MTGNAIDRRTFVRASIAATATVAAPAILHAQEKVVNLYSARHYDTDERLYEDFTKATGIRINRVEAQPDPLIERMKSEGANSPADVFISVDAGRLERAREIGLLQPLKRGVRQAREVTRLVDQHRRLVLKRCDLIVDLLQRASRGENILHVVRRVVDDPLRGCGRDHDR